MLNERCNTRVWNEDHYVLALESALISYYAFDDCDPRLEKDALFPGNLGGKKESGGYLVYLAFKYKKTEETEAERPDGKTEDGVEGNDSV